MRLLWLEDARDDLVLIRRYIAQHNPRAAQATSQRIRDAVGKLRTAPHLGRPGRWPGTRELVIPGTPYLVPYRVRDDAIEILCVFHGAREWPEP